jgi:SAM-dependent methyltransferase
MLKRILDFSWAYELLQNILGSPRARRIYINEYVKPQKGMRILDIGCGPGVIVPELMGKGVDYFGFDLNRKYIETAKRKYENSKVKFVSGDATDFVNAGNEKFDIVMMNNLMHHLTDAEVEASLAKVKKLLKKKGRFCSCDGVYDKDVTPIERFVLQNDRGKYIRTTNEYVRLVKKHIPSAKYTIVRGLIYIPSPGIIFY